MQLLTCDWETYYSKDYSLSKMTTEEYVRHSEFEAIGISVKVDNAAAQWYSGDDIPGFLSQFDWSNSAVLCHNTVFDGAIFSWRYGIRPKLWLDTLSMARPNHTVKVGLSLAALAQHYDLGVKGTEVVDAMGLRRADFSPGQLAAYGRYCSNDVELTYKLFKILRKQLPTSELMVIDQTLRMYTEPTLVVDKAKLAEHLQDVVSKRDKFLEDTAARKGVTVDDVKKMLMSNPQLAAWLETLGQQAPLKISKTTGKPTFAFAKTDQAFLDLLESPDEEVANLAAARLGVKSTIEESRTKRLIGVADRGPLPVMLQYYAAHTGRFGGGDKMNLQNLPKGTPDAPGKLRASLRAPKGKLLVACDSSQIEARTLAWLSGQHDLLEDFRRNADPYSKFASVVYGFPVNKSMKTERFVGKTCIAEGALVLTEKRGEVPIEEITLEDRVWDGVEWVSHEGLIDQGIKDVITYQGLTATPDHGVFTDQGPLPFGVAASRLANLITAAVDGQALRLSGIDLAGDATPEETHLRVRALYELWHNEVDQQGKLSRGENSRVSELFTNEVSSLDSSRGEVRRNQEPLYQPEEPGVSALRWQGDQAFIQLSDGLHPMGGSELASSDIQRGGDRPSGQFRALRSGEPSARLSFAASQEQAHHQEDHVSGWAHPSGGTPGELHVFNGPTPQQARAYGGTDRRKVRVYDLANCGPRRRFTVTGKLVCNCVLGLGYGMGADKLQRTLEIGQGGIAVKVDRTEAQKYVDTYRRVNSRIKNQWYEASEALERMVLGGKGTIGKSIKLTYDGDFILLPNGMQINYAGLQRDPRSGQFFYLGNKEARQWPRVCAARMLTGKAREDMMASIKWTYIYGGKVIENIVQALARIIVADQMVKIGQRYKVVLQVHDEIVICVGEGEVDEARAFMEQVMRTPPDWAFDLPVDCESGVGETYGESK